MSRPVTLSPRKRALSKTLSRLQADHDHNLSGPLEALGFDLATIGYRIRTLRLSAQMSQLTVCQAVKKNTGRSVTRVTLAHLESGGEVKLQTLLDVLTVFGTNLQIQLHEQFREQIPVSPAG